MTGTVDATFFPLVGVVEQVRSGRLRALAVASTGQSTMLPEVPTFAEASYPVYNARAWAGLLAAAATPAPVIERLAQASARGAAARDPRVREQLWRARHGQLAGGLCALHAQ